MPPQCRKNVNSERKHRFMRRRKPQWDVGRQWDRGEVGPRWRLQALLSLPHPWSTFLFIFTWFTFFYIYNLYYPPFIHAYIIYMIHLLFMFTWFILSTFHLHDPPFICVYIIRLSFTFGRSTFNLCLHNLHDPPFICVYMIYTIQL